jgi:hypothetical protein
MTQARIETAARMAKAGQKDEARSWLNFIEQAQLPTILAEQGCDVTKLKAELREAFSLCHPLDQYKPPAADYQAVKDEVARLASLIETLVRPSVTVSVSQTGGGTVVQNTPQTKTESSKDK